MAAPADILRTSSPPPPSSHTAVDSTLVLEPCTPMRRSAGAARHSDPPSTSSPLFSPDADDDENTLRLVLSPIRSVLSGRGIGTVLRPAASPLRCKGTEGADNTGDSAGKEEKDGDALVDTPASSLPAASDDEEEEEETGRRGSDDEEEQEKHGRVAQRLWSDTLPPSSRLPPPSPLLSSSDALPDAPDSAGAGTSSQPQTPTSTCTTGREPDGNVDLDLDLDAMEMEAFWTSLEAFLGSSSESLTSLSSTADTITTAIAAGSAGQVTDEDDDFAKLWGKAWSVADVDAEASLVDLAQADHTAALNLKAEDILQQNIFA
ncbi:hypothetical protein BJV78DRAFT_1229204 [Lactifluus subvellereus]|nr:hypothetical protein BJV78DRAFT_1229204 [Lactifluus subvellereus]